ncbi:hypothetical protein Pan97_23220 [Bremerella volcania]|uniref:Uncharacterized protein n=1 Tax=Bremerella volcania TaxID=2527984 RepID=A0A518C7W7_9BACT|nr:hypothetical protein Pan97_23220 [Bremerella volcania]
MISVVKKRQHPVDPLGVVVYMCGFRLPTPFKQAPDFFFVEIYS